MFTKSQRGYRHGYWDLSTSGNCWERPIPNLPAPWQGVCFVANASTNAKARERGIPPQTDHECSLTLQNRFDLILTRRADNPLAIPTLRINYFPVAAEPPPVLRFPDGRTFTAPRDSVGGASPGWRGAEAQHLLPYLLRTKTVQVRYLALPSWDEPGVHEITLSLTGLARAWPRLRAALAALPIVDLQ